MSWCIEQRYFCLVTDVQVLVNQKDKRNNSYCHDAEAHSLSCFVMQSCHFNVANYLSFPMNFVVVSRL